MKNKDEIIYVLTKRHYILDDKELYVTFDIFANDAEHAITKSGKLKLKKMFKFSKFKFQFENNCVYKIKARKSNDNIYEVIDVLEKNCYHEQIDKMKKTMDKGYCLDYLNYNFKLNSANSWYETKIDQLLVTIDAKEDNIFELCSNKEQLSQLLDEKFREKIKVDVANRMVDKANDWIDSEEDLKYTSETLYNIIKLESIYIDDTSCKFCYEAGDVFGGHYIDVYIENNEISDIDLVG